MTKRQPKGIPVGGQFAESARAEADVAAPTQGSVAERADEILGGRITQLPYEICDISEETAAVNPAYRGMTFDEAVTEHFSGAAQLLEEHGEGAEAVIEQDRAAACVRAARLFKVKEVLLEDPNSQSAREDYEAYERDDDDWVGKHASELKPGWVIGTKGDDLRIWWAGSDDHNDRVKSTEAGRETAQQFAEATETLQRIGQLRAIRDGAAVWSFLKPTRYQEMRRDNVVPDVRRDAVIAATLRASLRSYRARAAVYEGMSDEEIGEKVKSRLTKDGTMNRYQYGMKVASDLWYDKAAKESGNPYFEALTDQELDGKIAREVEYVQEARDFVQKADGNYDSDLGHAASKLAYYEQLSGYPGGDLSPQFSRGVWSDKPMSQERFRAIPTRAGFEGHRPPDLGGSDATDTGMDLDEMTEKYGANFSQKASIETLITRGRNFR